MIGIYWCVAKASYQNKKLKDFQRDNGILNLKFFIKSILYSYLQYNKGLSFHFVWYKVLSMLASTRAWLILSTYTFKRKGLELGGAILQIIVARPLAIADRLKILVGKKTLDITKMTNHFSHTKKDTAKPERSFFS